MNYILRAKRKGFSLAEAMMATVVLSIASAGVLLPFTSGQAVRAEGIRATLAAKLAGDLIEQIIRTPFDPDMIPGSYAEAQGDVKDADDVVFTDSKYAKLSRTAEWDYVWMPQESRKASPRFILVTVRVHYSGKEIAAVRRLVSQ